MVRTRLNIGCRYSTPVRERPLHPTRSHFTPEPSQTQAPVTPRDRAGATRRWKLNNTRRIRAIVSTTSISPPPRPSNDEVCSWSQNQGGQIWTPITPNRGSMFHA